jgi:3-hydroxyacyl-CoA dehydrogenase
MRKQPLILQRGVPGFVWNRIQFAVLRECLHPLDEGVADASAIDAAVSDGLAPRWLAAGPLATAELGGIDTSRRAAENLFPSLDASATVTASLAGEPDRGFYRWTAASRRSRLCAPKRSRSAGSWPSAGQPRRPKRAGNAAAAYFRSV